MNEFNKELDKLAADLWMDAEIFSEKIHKHMAVDMQSPEKKQEAFVEDVKRAFTEHIIGDDEDDSSLNPGAFERDELRADQRQKLKGDY